MKRIVIIVAAFCGAGIGIYAFKKKKIASNETLSNNTTTNSKQDTVSYVDKDGKLVVVNNPTNEQIQEAILANGNGSSIFFPDFNIQIPNVGG
jgi:hypothetical protein